MHFSHAQQLSSNGHEAFWQSQQNFSCSLYFVTINKSCMLSELFIDKVWLLPFIPWSPSHLSHAFFSLQLTMLLIYLPTHSFVSVLMAILKSFSFSEPGHQTPHCHGSTTYISSTTSHKKQCDKNV